MSKNTSRASSARRNAELLLGRAQKREASFRLEQEREYEAMTLKTARLRELRLAKEAAEQKTELSNPTVSRPLKPRRSKQT
jgi:hypothetical protein